MLPAKMLVKLASKFCLEPLRYAPGSRGLFLVRMIRRWRPLARVSAIMRMGNRGGAMDDYVRQFLWVAVLCLLLAGILRALGYI